MKRWIIGCVLLVVAMVVCSRADASVVILSDMETINTDGGPAGPQSLQSINQGGISGSLVNPDYEPNQNEGYPYGIASETASVGPTEISAVFNAFGFHGVANTTLSVNFSVVGNPELVSIYASSLDIEGNLGGIGYFDVAGSGGYFDSEFGQGLLAAFGLAGVCSGFNPVTFTEVLPVGNYSISASGDAETEDVISADMTLDIQFSSVPEPSTLIVWSLLGTLGIGVAWWRKRKAA